MPFRRSSVFRTAGVAAACCLIGGAARAEETGGGTRIERRVLVKKHKLYLSLGVGWFARDDYYNNPGLLGSITYYPIESGGIDLRVGGFFSYMSPAAREIFTRYDSAPAAQQPAGLAMVGWRQSFAYGKLMIADRLDSVVHFDLQATGHVGTVITTAAVNPAASVGLGLLVSFTRFHLQLDVPFVISREITPLSSVAAGVLPALSIGVSL